MSPIVLTAEHAVEALDQPELSLLRRIVAKVTEWRRGEGLEGPPPVVLDPSMPGYRLAAATEAAVRSGREARREAFGRSISRGEAFVLAAMANTEAAQIALAAGDLKRASAELANARAAIEAAARAKAMAAAVSDKSASAAGEPDEEVAP